MSTTQNHSIEWRNGSIRFGMIPDHILSAPDLSSAAKTLYGIMAMLASFSDGSLAAPQEEFAERMGVSKRTVQRVVTELEQAGHLIVTATSHEIYGRGWNQYQLVWDSTADQAADDPALDVPTPVDPHDTGVATPTTPVSLPLQTESIQTYSLLTYWDELEGVFGYSPQSVSERGLWGRLCKELAVRGADAADIPLRALTWSYHYDTPLTPATLLNKWDWLGGRTARASPSQRATLKTALIERAAENDYWQAVAEREDAG